jgi:hypothetical protein
MIRIAIAFVVAAAATAGAQPAKQPAAAGSASAPAPAAAPTKRDRIKQRIQALRAYTLIDELGLDEASSGKLLVVFAKYDDEFSKLLAVRGDLQKKLAAVTDKDAKATVDKLIDDAVANQRAMWDVEARRLDELRKSLTPAQTARLLVVLPRLERKIQNQLRRAITGNPDGPGRGAEKAPAAGGGKPWPYDDDDDAPAPAKRGGRPPTPQRSRDVDPLSDRH